MEYLSKMDKLSYTAAVEEIKKKMVSVVMEIEGEYKVFDVEIAQGSQALYSFLQAKSIAKPANYPDLCLECTFGNGITLTFSYRVLHTTNTSLSDALSRAAHGKLTTTTTSNHTEDATSYFGIETITATTIKQPGNEKMNTEITEQVTVGDYEFNTPNYDIEMAEEAMLEFARELKKVKDARDAAKETMGFMPKILDLNYTSQIEELNECIYTINDITQIPN